MHCKILHELICKPLKVTHKYHHLHINRECISCASGSAGTGGNENIYMSTNCGHLIIQVHPQHIIQCNAESAVNGSTACLCIQTLFFWSSSFGSISSLSDTPIDNSPIDHDILYCSFMQSQGIGSGDIEFIYLWVTWVPSLPL